MNLPLVMKWDKGSHGWYLHKYLKCVKCSDKDQVDWAVSYMDWWIQKRKSQWTETGHCGPRYAVAVAVAAVASALAEGASGVAVAAVSRILKAAVVLSVSFGLHFPFALYVRKTFPSRSY